MGGYVCECERDVFQNQNVSFGKCSIGPGQNPQEISQLLTAAVVVVFKARGGAEGMSQK